MHELIIEKLKELEQKENIRILHAVESGSRAWGFPSPDSDYDVRFFYVRPREEYLRLEKVRDTIELPINGLLDINGWDLNKMLQLLHGANPTLFEWASSPIVYRDTGFVEKLRPLMAQYFSPKKAVYHYLSMADSNYREYLKGELVRAKKYFYVLRPLLAARWVMDKKTPPPMLFRELVDAELAPALLADVERLLDLKMNSPEIKLIPRVDMINAYLDESLLELKAKAADIAPVEQADWQPLDDFFLEMLAP